MKRIIFFLGVALTGCATESQDRSHLDLYDRLDMLMAMYNAALDSRNYTEQARIEVTVTREAQRQFDALLQDCAESPEFRERNLACFALGFSKRLEAAPTLRERLDDPDPTVRVQAAVALGQLGAPNPPVERVKKMLDEPSEYVRLGALFALKMMLVRAEDAGLGKRLIGLLQDPSERIRNEAVLLMGQIKKPDFIAPLGKTALKDEAFLVRYNAALMLGKYGPAAETVIRPLIDALKDFEAPVVEAAHWALKCITEKDFDRSYHTWDDWYVEEWAQYEYTCRTHPDVVRSVPELCPKCQEKLERRRKPAAPKPPPDEKKEENK
ncbi:MAG: HEAT repeat domain-containing protein [Planctomycetes bacterium]|nr:HEAT repeat domain-containing protein [Planctomycetota bacterium]